MNQISLSGDITTKHYTSFVCTTNINAIISCLTSVQPDQFMMNIFLQLMSPSLPGRAEVMPTSIN